jgi:RNA 2',3'-cyclic 3'-phosphodiesterase
MRCFIALCLPEEARRSLARTAEACRKELDADRAGGDRPQPRVSWAPPRISWVRPEGYHLTLAFLGEIEGAAIEAAASALDAASGFEAIDCRFAGLGGFPFGGGAGKKGSSAGFWRVLFAELDDGGGCAELHRAVNETLAERARLAGLPPLNPEWPKGGTGGRAFAPHITLARAQGGSGIPSEAARWAETAHPETWTIGRCALYKSELRRTGSVYTEIRGVDLSGK